MAAARTDYDVVVVGAGVSGCTAAHAVATQAPSASVLVIERGQPGRGSAATLRGDPEATPPFVSGTAVFDAPHPATVKQMCTLFAGTCDEFLHHHSEEDGRTFFKMTNRGLALQKRKAARVLPDLARQLRARGTLILGKPEEDAAVRREHVVLRRMGANCELWERDKVVAATGESSGFVVGLWFGDEAVIDSASYAACLLDDAAKRSDRFTVWRNSPEVTRIDDGDTATGPPATVHLESGKRVTAGRVVVATGAFFHQGPLAGIIRPCYSYLVAMPARPPSAAQGGGMEHPISPNLITFNHSHDWCVVDGFVRMSGEDGFSGLKGADLERRCRRLAQWTHERFPQLDPSEPYACRAGVYSETPDLLPVFGAASDTSRVCYVLGCNAWGQTPMSCLGDMVPAALGLREYDADERAIAALCSVRRFAVACGGGRGADAATLTTFFQCGSSNL